MRRWDAGYNSGVLGINYKNASEVFDIPAGETMEEHEFTDVAEMEDVTAEGYLETTTGQASDTVSGFTTRFFMKWNARKIMEW